MKEHKADCQRNNPSRLGFSCTCGLTKNVLKLKERDIQKAILEYLRLKKIFCWKQSTVGIKKPDGSWIPTTMTGIADILGILPDGRFLAIEVKSPDKGATLAQITFLENIKSRGGVAFVAHSVDEVMQHLGDKNG